MIRTEEDEKLRELTNRKPRVHVVATGAGAGIVQRLWRIPGCSAFLSGASFPYAMAETVAWLGFEPDQFVSEETAIDLAMGAYMRAVDPEHPEAEAVGLGVTASVASVAPHRGEHRVYAACMTRNRVGTADATFVKGHGIEARRVDGSLVDDIAMCLLLESIGAKYDSPRTSQMARGQFLKRPIFTPASRRLTVNELPAGAALFPGAFDPPHAGHFGIAAKADCPVAFAICATPPHKGPLTTQEMLRRAKMLAGQWRLFTEGDALYVDKAERFPGRKLLLGADALIRMVDPRWGVDVGELAARFHASRTEFHIFGRQVDGVYVSGVDAVMRMSESLRGICFPIHGRWDVSSTELRSQASG